MTEKELLLTALLDCRRVDLYTNNFHLTKQKKNELSVMLQRRKQGEPVQYISGFTEFMGIYFRVDSRALIPRPETEILVEKVLELINDNFTDKKLKVLDLCTGCGNIAVSLAALSAVPHIFASDVSEAALELAGENAQINNVQDKITFLKSDLFQQGFGDKKEFFDLIVCNPPYLKTAELDNSVIELKFEPRIALDAGKNGLIFYRKIIQDAPKYLKQGGYLVFEIGYSQLASIKKILSASKEFSLEKTVKDYNNIDRVVFLRKNKLSEGIFLNADLRKSNADKRR